MIRIGCALKLALGLAEYAVLTHNTPNLTKAARIPRFLNLSINSPITISPATVRISLPYLHEQMAFTLGYTPPFTNLTGIIAVTRHFQNLA